MKTVTTIWKCFGMKKVAVGVVAASLLLLTLALPLPLSARHGSPTPTPTSVPPTPTPTLTGSQLTPTPTVTPFAVTTTSMPDGNVCANYSAFIIANKGGGASLDTWKIVSGTLPAGLTMAQSYGIMSTVVYGTPTTVQTTTFTVQVQDSAGETATKTLSIAIDPPLPLVITNQSSTLASGTVGTPYSASFFSHGGCLPLV
jgi:hypothetical protein